MFCRKEKAGSNRGRKSGKWGRFFLKWGTVAGILAAVFLFIVQIVPYHGISMYPSIRDGDLLVIYKPGKYQIGDVVRYKASDGKQRLGRIMAMEGQVIDITESGEWTRNGTVPSETEYYPTSRSEDSSLVFPYTVEEDGLFILNDYRPETEDSRLYGTVPQERVIGKVIFVLRIRSI